MSTSLSARCLTDLVAALFVVLFRRRNNTISSILDRIVSAIGIEKLPAMLLLGYVGSSVCVCVCVCVSQ